MLILLFRLVMVLAAATECGAANQQDDDVNDAHDVNAVTTICTWCSRRSTELHSADNAPRQSEQAVQQKKKRSGLAMRRRNRKHTKPDETKSDTATCHQVHRHVKGNAAICTNAASRRKNRADRNRRDIKRAEKRKFIFFFIFLALDVFRKRTIV